MQYFKQMSRGHKQFFSIYSIYIVMSMMYDYMIVNITALQLRPHLIMILTEVSIHKLF